MTDQLDGFFLDFFFSNLYLRKDENQKNRSDSTCKKNLRYDAVRLSESQDLFEKKLYSINYDFPTSKILKKNFNESQNFSENSEPSFVKIIDHNQSISGKIKAENCEIDPIAMMIKAIFIMKEEILEEMTKKMDLIFGKTNSSDSSIVELKGLKNSIGSIKVTMKKLGRQLIASNKKQKSCVGRDLEKAILKKENFYFKREFVNISAQFQEQMKNKAKEFIALKNELQFYKSKFKETTNLKNAKKCFPNINVKNESISLENRQKSLKKEKEKNNFPIFSLVTDDGNLNYNLNLSNIYERKPCEDSSQYIKKNKPSFSDDKEKPFKEKEKLGKRILIEKEKSPIKVKLPYQFKLDLSTLKKSD